MRGQTQVIASLPAPVKTRRGVNPLLVFGAGFTFDTASRHLVLLPRVCPREFSSPKTVWISCHTSRTGVVFAVYTAVEIKMSINRVTVTSAFTISTRT